MPSGIGTAGHTRAFDNRVTVYVGISLISVNVSSRDDCLPEFVNFNFTDVTMDIPRLLRFTFALCKIQYLSPFSFHRVLLILQ